jgi:hypothetical protein
MLDFTELFNAHKGGVGIFIGSGASGKLAAEQSPFWFDRNYDFALVPNASYTALAEVAKLTRHVRWYSMCVEGALIRRPWWWHIPEPFTRIIDHVSYGKWAETYMHKKAMPASRFDYLHASYESERTQHCDKFSCRRYTCINEKGEKAKGLLLGPADYTFARAQQAGTVGIQSIHFAGLLGASKLTMLGYELAVVDGIHHYFAPHLKPFEPCNASSNNVRPIDPRDFTDAVFEGVPCRTFKQYANDVPLIERIYPICNAEGLRIVRSCVSLATTLPFEKLPA